MFIRLHLNPLTTIAMAVAILCLVAAGSATAIAVHAQQQQDSTNCIVDEDGSGFVEIAELFNVINWYFAQTLCAAPQTTGWITGTAPNGGPTYTVASQQHTSPSDTGPWWLNIECEYSGENAPVNVYLGTFWGIIYSSTDDPSISISTDLDGTRSDQIWTYYAPSETYADHLVHDQPSIFAGQLFTADEAAFIIPATDDPHSVTFNVSGLGDLVDDFTGLCNSGE